MIPRLARCAVRTVTWQSPPSVRVVAAAKYVYGSTYAPSTVQCDALRREDASLLRLFYRLDYLFDNFKALIVRTARSQYEVPTVYNYFDSYLLLVERLERTVLVFVLALSIHHF